MEKLLAINLFYSADIAAKLPRKPFDPTRFVKHYADLYVLIQSNLLVLELLTTAVEQKSQHVPLTAEMNALTLDNAEKKARLEAAFTELNVYYMISY